MQFLPALTSDPAAAAREQAAGRHLPYGRHVDDHTIETRDGLLVQVIQLRGLLFETADTDEINYRKRLRDATLQAVGSLPLSLSRRLSDPIGFRFEQPMEVDDDIFHFGIVDRALGLAAPRIFRRRIAVVDTDEVDAGEVEVEAARILHAATKDEVKLAHGRAR